MPPRKQSQKGGRPPGGSASRPGRPPAGKSPRKPEGKWRKPAAKEGEFSFRSGGGSDARSGNRPVHKGPGRPAGKGGPARPWSSDRQEGRDRPHKPAAKSPRPRDDQFADRGDRSQKPAPRTKRAYYREDERPAPRSTWSDEAPPRAERPDRPRVPRERRSGGGAAGGGYWLYGTHAVAAALANPERRVRRLLMTVEAEGRLKGTLPHGVTPESCDRDRLEEIFGRGAVHQGVAILVDPLPERTIASIAPVEGQRNTVVLLDQVTDPHNVGAIVRSAAAFGARAVIVTERHAPEETAVMAKAASGALERVPVIRVPNLARALDEVAALGYWSVGLSANSKKSLAQVATEVSNAALVLGAEGEGLRRLTSEKVDFAARLPMTGDTESLNVSNAAAVALYALFIRD